MQQFARLVRGLSSPATLIIVVWVGALVGIATGPIEYPMQPTPTVLALVAAGVFLFLLAHWIGIRSFSVWFQRRPNLPAARPRMLNRVVVATSLAGIAGIGLMALDRQLLSGVDNGGYAELMRCAPALVDFIQLKRTPLLYVGYLTFSFGFASMVLFLLKGEEIRGWPAALAQLSIVSPVGYALLYSGRMPILFVIVLIAAAMLVRVGQGQRPLPPGHHLLIKMILVVVLFAMYSSAIWSRRQTFCVKASGLIQELHQRQQDRNANQTEFERESKTRIEAGNQPRPQPRPADTITAVDLSKKLDTINLSKKPEEKAPPKPDAAVDPELRPVDTLLATMKESWNVKPRPYVMSALDSGRLSPGAAMTVLSTSFYFSHGVRTIDIAWRVREKFSPQWGLYEIGVLSPILRVFFPHYDAISNMETQLKDTLIFGFFPTVWVAAFVDFGLTGAIVYVLIWGFAAGWSAFGARHSGLATPPLLLIFILASILLSPVQGPLGVANSALVLLSLLATGAAIDLSSLRTVSRHQARESMLRAPG